MCVCGHIKKDHENNLCYGVVSILGMVKFCECKKYEGGDHNGRRR